MVLLWVCMSDLLNIQGKRAALLQDATDGSQHHVTATFSL